MRLLYIAKYPAQFVFKFLLFFKNPAMAFCGAGAGFNFDGAFLPRVLGSQRCYHCPFFGLGVVWGEPRF